ncbi:MAG TPA: hypothetical protein PLK77_00005, partial [Pyrinomonadaceae bacterium]|nr:hypothetical protein [Pyrinomonadaceae bacterium]
HNGGWTHNRTLDGKSVSYISAFFEDTPDIGEPALITENIEQVFRGSIFLGDGFVLNSAEKEDYWRNSDNRSVIFPLLNGENINSNPEQAAERAIICLEDYYSENGASEKFPELVDRLRERVLPERLKQKNLAAQKKWWRYYRYNTDGYDRIREAGQCFVSARTTKHLSFSLVSSQQVFTDAVNIFVPDRWDLYTVVQSTLHEVWARKYSGALKQDLRYSPSNCFETFAFPGNIWDEENEALAEIGERYHEHRPELMLSLWLGLTKIYNLFHNPDLAAETVQRTSGKDEETARDGYAGLLELRRLHVEMDNTVRDAYGWQDLDLEHGFHEVETLPENDRTRYTISPTARKEVLKRLLALNHTRAAEEEARAATAKPVKKKGGKKSKPDPATDGDNPLLSAGPLFE